MLPLFAIEMIIYQLDNLSLIILIYSLYSKLMYEVEAYMAYLWLN